MTSWKWISPLATAFAAAAFASALGACGSSNDGASVTSNLKLASQLSTSMTDGYVASPFQAFLTGSPSSSALIGDVASSATTDIQRLKYKIFNIAVCDTLTINGTAFTPNGHCLTIYDSGDNNQSGTWAYNPQTMDPVAMASTVLANETQLIDLMDTSSRAKLGNTVKVSSSDAISYNWGYINWYPDAVLQAQVAVTGGAIRTKSDGAVQSSGKWMNTTPLTTGTVGESVVSTGNGGTWFKFQNPLTISSDDVKNKTAYQVDLTFDPDGFVKAVDANAASGCGTCAIMDSSNNAITEPILDITPIPHKGSDHVKREVYVAAVTGATATYSIKLKLYYLDTDAQKTIYGVNVNTFLSAATSPSFVYNFPKIAYISSNADGSTNFLDWDNSFKLIQSFNRKTNVGDTTTATINCGANGAHFFTPDCSNSSFTATFTLTSVDTLQ